MTYQHRSIGFFPLLAIIILFSTAGCIRTTIPIAPPANTPPPNTPPSSGPFSATLADTAWTALYYTAYFYQGQGLFKLTGIADGKNGDSTSLQVMFRTPFQLNQPISTYNEPLDVNYGDMLNTYAWDAGNSSGVAVCYLNITAYDSASHTIAGNFYGGLSWDIANTSYSDTISVKNGAFNLTYTLQP
jgi:hypothetical protein